MGQKKMNSEKKIRFFAWRQENVTTKSLQTYKEAKVICDGIVGCCT